jgi:hypothetical protein
MISAFRVKATEQENNITNPDSIASFQGEEHEGRVGRKSGEIDLPLPLRRSNQSMIRNFLKLISRYDQIVENKNIF